MPPIESIARIEIRFITGQPYLLLSLTAALWAGNAIAGKFAVGHISPFTLTCMRWLVASLVLLPFAYPHIRRDWKRVRENLFFLFTLGAVGFALFNNLFYLALNHTTVINVAIEQASMPLIVFALNFVLFSIAVSWLQIAGFALTMIGVVMTVTGGDVSGIAAWNINIGDVYMMVAVLLYGMYSVALVRKPPLHWLSFIMVLSCSALLASIPFAAWEFLAGHAVPPDTTGLAVVVYTAIFPSIIAQLSWVRGLEIIGSNRGGIFINLVPIFASVLAVLLLGEAFLFHHLAAMCLVLSGVWLSQKSRLNGTT